MGVEKEIPQESNDLYSIYQQNVHKFFNEFYKSISQYQQYMTNLQLEWFKSCGMMLNPTLAFSENFENTSLVTTSPEMNSATQQTKIEKDIAYNHTIENKTPSKLPPLKFSSIISSEEIRPSKSKKTRKFDAETFWKNQYTLKRGKLPRIAKVQDEKIKIFANKHSQDLSFMTNDQVVTNGECQNCGKLLEDPLLTHCSNVCLFEDYLKSQSASLTLIES